VSRPMVAKRHNKLWFIGVFAVGLIVLFAIQSSRKAPKSVELDESLIRVQAPALLPMDASKVSQVDVTLSGQRMLATKSGEKWILKTPFNDDADFEAVERVIGLFSALASDEVAESASKSEYGLDRPFATATFIEDGQTRRFTIGRYQRTELYYAKTSASEDIYVVRGLPEELKVLRPIDLVNRQLLTFNPDDVVRIEAKATEDDIHRVVERREGKWFTSLGAPGVVFQVEEFLRDLRFVNVSDVVSAAGGQGLSPVGSTMRIVITRNDGKKHTLDVGNQSSDGRRYFVKSSDRPHVYQVVQFIGENLREKMRQVGTDMMGLNPDRVMELRLITVHEATEEDIQKKKEISTAALLTGVIKQDDLVPGAKERVLSKSDETWTTDGKVAFSVGAVVDAIIGVSAQTAAPEGDDETYGFYPAVGAVQIIATLDNKAKITLDVGTTTPDGKMRYVRSSSRSGVYLSPAQNVDVILNSLSRVRSELMVFDPAQVTKITVSESDWSGKTSSRVLSKQGGRWMHAGKARDEAGVDAFLKNVRALGAESIPPKEDDESVYGFYPAAESWRLELGFRDGTNLVLDSGATKSEGSGWFAIVNYYVRISDLSDIVFVGEFDIDGLRDDIDDILR
jgi:hypothetical protein